MDKSTTPFPMEFAKVSQAVVLDCGGSNPDAKFEFLLDATATVMLQTWASLIDAGIYLSGIPTRSTVSRTAQD